MATPKVHLKKIKRKKETTYQIDYRVNRRRIRLTVGPNKHEAELIRTDIQRDLLLGKFSLPTSQSTKIHLDKLIEEFLDEKRNRVRESSLKRYKNYLDRLKAYYKEYFPAPAADISLISDIYMNKFITHALHTKNETTKPWTAATINDSIKLIRSLFKFAIKKKYITKNPLEDIKAIREKSASKANYFTKDDRDRIYKILDPHWVDATQFMINTGLRKGELINLKWDSVSLVPGKESITVEGCDEWDTKTGKWRIIPLNSEALAIINKQMNKNAEFVFTAKEGGQIHPDKIYHAIKNALTKLKLKGTVHTLRHTFASILAMNGVDLISIRDLLGQVDVETTQIYAHLAPEHLRKAVNELAA